MKKQILIFIACLIPLPFFAQVNIARINDTDTPNDIIRKAANIVPSARQLKWQQQELTAFLHFGINTFTDKEWGDGKENPQLFNPTKFDAAQWIKIIKQAGFKQVIITAKHHDGFCLWPSKFTNHSVKASPWKNGNGDVLKELSSACKKNNINFGVYLSPWDRNNTLYGTEAYNDFFANQLTELLSNYGNINEVWFDGANGEGPNGKKQRYDFERWYSIIRKLQPNAVIAVMGPDVRWVGTETGYGRNTEWSVIPIDHLNPSNSAANAQQDIAFAPVGNLMDDDLGSREKIVHTKGLAWYPAEVDVSIRPGWFYHENENNQVKNVTKLMDIYVNSVGKNGLLLLNIPPDKTGRINAADSAVLMQWKTQRDIIFKNQLAKNARLSCTNGINTMALIDNNPNTAFTTNADDTTTTIEIKLDKATSINVLQLQENITQGQRIENFTFDAWINNAWKQIANGTTVGYKRILSFEAVKSNKFRLQIVGARLNPSIAEMGLYYWSKEKK